MENKVKNIITVTDKAIEELKRMLLKEENKNLSVRLEIQGGGCSGLSYKLSYSEIKERDHIIEENGIKILVDKKSAIYLKGIKLDFNDSLNGRGFTFTNPNASNTCGCGESFSV